MKQIQKISSWITSCKVAGNRISVDLPKEFDAQEVQIIIRHYTDLFQPVDLTESRYFANNTKLVG